MTTCYMPFIHVGSKWNLAPDLVRMVRRAGCDTYVEPFAGSLAVLLSKPPHSIEVVNDLDDDIVNFFTVLRDEPDEFIRRCELTPYAREELDRAKSELVFVHEPVERARLWWVTKTQTINGKGDTFRCAPSISLTDFTSRLRAVADRLHGVAIENTDALELIGRMDSTDTVFYLDPPYLGSTRHSGTRYKVDQRGDDFHTAMLDAIVAAKATVILSGYPSPLYENALAGWYRAEYQVQASTNSINGKGYDNTRTEVVWCNRDIVELHQTLF